MRDMVKYVAAFFIVVFVGLGTVWVFTTFVFDPSHDSASSKGKPKTGLARTVQLNPLLAENAFPNLNRIIKANKGNPAKMQEQISIAYRSLPLLETMPSHGAVIMNNTEGAISGLLIVDATNTPGFNTLVTLTGRDHDKFGNIRKIITMVEGGRVLEIPVPKNEYNIEFASGGAWFGSRILFGPLTDRLAFDGAFVFDDKNLAYQLTIYPKEGADFQIGTVRLKSIPKHDRTIKEKIGQFKETPEGN